MDGQTDEHTRFSAETLNPDTPKKIPITLNDTLTLRDTHYTEWYPLQTHPKEYPLHWMIPITDTPKWIPITLSDTGTLSDFSSHREFSQPTQEFTPYTEGPCFPHEQTGHGTIPMTLRETPDPEWYPLPWVLLANRIPDRQTHTNFFI